MDEGLKTEVVPDDHFSLFHYILPNRARGFLAVTVVFRFPTQYTPSAVHLFLPTNF